MRGVRVATWDEVLAYGQPGLSGRGLLAPMRGGAGYALVSLGTAVTVNSTTFATATFGQATTANNLLIAWAGELGSANTISTTSTGWNQAFNIKTGAASAAVYYKIAAGSDAAPVFAGLGATNRSVLQLGEFSGNATGTVLDQTGTGGAITATYTATAAAPDTASGELICYAVMMRHSASTVVTDSVALNNATSNDTNNNSTSLTGHYVFGYGISTSNSSAVVATVTQTTTNLTDSSAGLRSFLLAAGAAAAIPDVVMAAN